MGFTEEQFVGDVDENLKCSICYEVMENPKQCSSGNSFCAGCITQCLKKKQECPLCKKALQVESLSPNLVAKNMIENLQVYCHPPESDEQAATKEEENKLKCDWTGKLQSLAKHRETCPFQQVQCTNDGCSTKMERRELEDHDKICEYKMVECDAKCGETFIRFVLPGHLYFDCPQVMVPCPNSCKHPETTEINTMRRIDVQDHVTNDCPKTVVDCPYKEHGCREVERQDVEKHVRENRDAHMMLLAMQCSTLTKQNTTLTEQCSTLKTKCLSLKQDFASLSEENQRLRDDVKKCDDLLRTYTWTIKDYQHYYRRTTRVGDDPPIIKLRSPNFWLCGFNWYLVLYPNGSNVNNRGYVSAFLLKGPDIYGSRQSSGARSLQTSSVEEINTPNSDVSVTCRLSVMSQVTGTPDVSSEKSGVLATSRHERCVIEWPNVMRSDEAVSEKYCRIVPRGYCNSTKGSLTIQCTIQLDKPQ